MMLDAHAKRASVAAGYCVERAVVRFGADGTTGPRLRRRPPRGHASLPVVAAVVGGGGASSDDTVVGPPALHEKLEGIVVGRRIFFSRRDEHLAPRAGFLRRSRGRVASLMANDVDDADDDPSGGGGPVVMTGRAVKAALATPYLPARRLDLAVVDDATGTSRNLDDITMLAVHASFAPPLRCRARVLDDVEAAALEATQRLLLEAYFWDAADRRATFHDQSRAFWPSGERAVPDRARVDAFHLRLDLR